MCDFGSHYSTTVVSGGGPAAHPWGSLFKRFPQLQPRRLLFTPSRDDWCCLGRLPPPRAPLGLGSRFTLHPQPIPTPALVSSGLFLYPVTTACSATFPAGDYDLGAIAIDPILSNLLIEPTPTTQLVFKIGSSYDSPAPPFSV